MTKISRGIRNVTRAATQYPGVIVDVAADGRATVCLSRNGAVYKILPVVGGPVDIGQRVQVDFTTPTPTIVAPGIRYTAVPTRKEKIRRGVPSYIVPEGKAFWNPFPSDEVLAVNNMNDALGATIVTNTISNTPTNTQHVVTGENLPILMCGYGNYLYFATGGSPYEFIRFNVLTGEIKRWARNSPGTVNPALVLDNTGRVYIYDWYANLGHWQISRINFDTGGREAIAQFNPDSGAYYEYDLIFIDHYVVAVSSVPIPATVRWLAYDVNTETFVSNSQNIEQETGPGADDIVTIKAAPVNGKVAVFFIKADNVSADFYNTCVVIDPAANTMVGPHDLVSRDNDWIYIGVRSSGSNAAYFITSNIGGPTLAQVTAAGDLDNNYATPGSLSTCDGDVYLASKTGDVISWTKLSDLSSAGSLTIASGYWERISTEADANGDLWVGAYNNTNAYFYRHNLKTGSNSNVTGLPSLVSIASIHQIGDRVIIVGNTGTEDVLIIAPEV